MHWPAWVKNDIKNDRRNHAIMFNINILNEKNNHTFQ